MLTWTPQLVASLTVNDVMLGVLLASFGYLILLERKICAWVQDRCGPNRVGPFGLLQPLADGIKLLAREEFLPRGADRVLFVLAPGMAVLPALIGFAVVPWASALDLAALPLLGKEWKRGKE